MRFGGKWSSKPPPHQLECLGRAGGSPSSLGWSPRCKCMKKHWKCTQQVFAITQHNKSCPIPPPSGYTTVHCDNSFILQLSDRWEGKLMVSPWQHFCPYLLASMFIQLKSLVHSTVNEQALKASAIMLDNKSLWYVKLFITDLLDMGISKFCTFDLWDLDCDPLKVHMSPGVGYIINQNLAKFSLLCSTISC